VRHFGQQLFVGLGAVLCGRRCRFVIVDGQTQLLGRGRVEGEVDAFFWRDLRAVVYLKEEIEKAAERAASAD
jgi:hypothetical protein